jgi:transcriptional regulator with XRE-family HTH domain
MIEILRRSREEMGWSLEELAGRMGGALGSLFEAENGESFPTVVFVFRWSHALGLDPGELFREGSRAARLEEES